MPYLHCRFPVIRHHIGSGSNPDLGPDIASRLLNLCYMRILSFFFRQSSYFLLLTLANANSYIPSLVYLMTNPSCTCFSDLCSRLYFSGVFIHFSFFPMLCFDLLTRPKMPFKVMHRKEVTHSDGSYERKLRGRKLADEMGRDKKIPLYSHRLTHRKRVTSELDDSYFTQAIPKLAEVTHPGR